MMQAHLGNSTDGADPRSLSLLLLASYERESDLYPPPLYSDANYQVSCDGAIVADIQDVTVNIGTQLWRSGLTLIGLSVLMGLSNWPSTAGCS